jgi:hypothetical protein
MISSMPEYLIYYPSRSQLSIMKEQLPFFLIIFFLEYYEYKRLFVFQW